jgi:hypothetical protein
MSQKIAVTISPTGVAKIDAQGFTGSACASATKPIEDALSGKGGATVTKPEFYEINTNAEEVKQGW